MTAVNSEFDLVKEKYVMRNGKPIFVAIVPSYGGPLVDKLREVEKRRGAEQAFDMLKKLSSGSLTSYIRTATNLDAIKAGSFQETEKVKFSRGTKYRCVCSQVFYDLLHDEAKCPSCGKHKAFASKVS